MTARVLLAVGLEHRLNNIDHCLWLRIRSTTSICYRKLARGPTLQRLLGQVVAANVDSVNTAAAAIMTSTRTRTISASQIRRSIAKRRSIRDTTPRFFKKCACSEGEAPAQFITSSMSSTGKNSARLLSRKVSDSGTVASVNDAHLAPVPACSCRRGFISLVVGDVACAPSQSSLIRSFFIDYGSCEKCTCSSL